MSELKIFSPVYLTTTGGAVQTVSLSLTTTGAASVALPVSPDGRHIGKAVRIYNRGSFDAYVEFGTSTGGRANTTGAVVTGSMPIAPGSVEMFEVPSDTHLWGIATGATTLFLTQGKGS